MDPDGNGLQNSCSPRHGGHSTMHRVPPVSGTTTTIYMLYMTLGHSSTTTCIDKEWDSQQVSLVVSEIEESTVTFYMHITCI